jgi:hypothetical protein
MTAGLRSSYHKVANSHPFKPSNVHSETQRSYSPAIYCQALGVKCFQWPLHSLWDPLLLQLGLLGHSGAEIFRERSLKVEEGIHIGAKTTTL